VRRQFRLFVKDWNSPPTKSGRRKVDKIVSSGGVRFLLFLELPEIRYAKNSATVHEIFPVVGVIHFFNPALGPGLA
jgi:hypothetical protein